MSSRAKAFAYTVIALGSAALIVLIAQWNCVDYARFATLVVFSGIASRLKFRLPGFTGTMTTSLLIQFIALLELSPGEAAVTAMFATLVQIYWRAQSKPTLVQVLFNLASANLSAAAAIAASRLLAGSGWHLGTPATLAIVCAVYFVLNTAAISIVVARIEGSLAFPRWTASYGWSFSIYLAGACVAGIVNYLSARHGWGVVFLVLPILYAFGWTFHVFIGRLEDSKRHTEEILALQFRSLETLAFAVEAQDETTHSHLHRVRTYAMEIGKDLGLSGEQLQALQAAAILHDVGKLAVPAYIISKPGKLTADEFELMKKHTVVGDEIVGRMGFPFPVAPLVRGHHEKWDGSGYPDGLAGEQIPIGARIVAAVDCFDALVTDRQYRRALPLEKAMEVVLRESGKSFDPAVVHVLNAKYAELAEKARATFVPAAPASANLQFGRGGGPDAGLEVSGAVRPALPSNGDSNGHAELLQTLMALRPEVAGLIKAAASVPAGIRGPFIAFSLSNLLQSSIPHDSCALFERAGDMLYARGAYGREAALLATLNVPFGQGVAGWVALNARPILNANPGVEPGTERWPERTSLQAALAVPLRARDRLSGVLILYRCEKDSFHQGEAGALRLLSSSLGEAFHTDRAPQPKVNRQPAGDLDFFRMLDSAARPGDPPARLVRIEIVPPAVAGNRSIDNVDFIAAAFPPGTPVARLGPYDFLALAPALPFRTLAEQRGTLLTLLAYSAAECFGPGRFRFAVGVVDLAHESTPEDALAAAEFALQEHKQGVVWDELDWTASEFPTDPNLLGAPAPTGYLTTA